MANPNNFREFTPIFIITLCISLLFTFGIWNYSVASHGGGSSGDACSGSSSCPGYGDPVYDSTGTFCGTCQPSCENTRDSHGDRVCGGCGCGFSGGGDGDKEENPRMNIYCNGQDSSCTIGYNTSATLSWSGECHTAQKEGAWGRAQDLPGSGSETVGPLTSTTTYGMRCKQPKEGGPDYVTVNVRPPPVPNNPSNVSVSQPNYCISGPAATVSWTYSDPSGSPQTAYQIQIDDEGSFGSPERDSGKVGSGSTSFFSGQGYLRFNTTYKARVRAWNSYDQVSNWTESNSFRTPNFAYPQVNFTWTQSGFNEPANPQLNILIQFIDQTAFGGNPLQREWNWLFGDGASSAQQNPTKKYETEGSYYVTLTAKDSQGQTCSRTKGPLNIQKPVPVWKEVPPR